MDAGPTDAPERRPAVSTNGAAPSDLLLDLSRDATDEELAALVRELSVASACHLFNDLGRLTEDEVVRARLRDAIFARILAASPAAAAETIGAMPPGMVRDNFVGRLVRSWQASDFSAALAWALALPGKASQQQALLQLSREWEVRDPQGALDAAVHLSTENNVVLQALVERLARRDPEEAAAWVAKLPASLATAQLRTVVLDTWAETEPEVVASYAESMPAGELRTHLMLSIASGWSALDPSATARWISGHASAEARGLSLKIVAEQWASRDLPAALDWVQHLPSGPDRDSLLETLAGAGSTAQ